VPLSKTAAQTPQRKGGSTMIMSDDDIEAMLRGLVEEHLAEDARKAALNWLEKRSITYQAMQNLGLLDEDGHD
jgi:hypothetical protein